VIESRRMIWTGHAVRMGALRKFRILGGISEGRIPICRQRRKGKGNIKI
jgi:hypothetical protein